MERFATNAASAAELVRIESEALRALAERLEGPEAAAFNSMLSGLIDLLSQGHRLVLTGMGKSGLIARKIASTLTSLSVPTSFLHPAEALHGDLGLLRHGDALLALSYSGETEEVLRLLPALEPIGVTLLSFTGCASSSLARRSVHTLDVSVEREACHHQLAPTASTTAMLALGDALAITLAGRLGYAPQSFAGVHPGGALGRRLTPVQVLAHVGAAIPCVQPDTAMAEVIHEMSAKRLGMTTVQDAGGQLLGVISDGDLRRLLEREGPAAFHRTAGQVMTTHPRTVAPGTLTAEALQRMEEHKITALLLAEPGAETLCTGVLHLHDLLRFMDVREAPDTAR